MFNIIYDPVFWCFQGVQKWDICLKWFNIETSWMVKYRSVSSTAQDSISVSLDPFWRNRKLYIENYWHLIKLFFLIFIGCVIIWTPWNGKNIVSTCSSASYWMHVYQGLRFRAGSKVYRGRVEDGPRTLCPGKVSLLSFFLLLSLWWAVLFCCK